MATWRFLATQITNRNKTMPAPYLPAAWLMVT